MSRVQGSPGAWKLHAPGGGAVAPMTNMRWVSKDGNDTTGDGSVINPYLTVSKAYESIGDAADNAEWNDEEKRFYLVFVAPGVYAESPSLPVRPSVWTWLAGSSIMGDVSLDVPAGLVTSGLGSPQWGFRGSGRRAVWDASGFHTINGIEGNINFTCNLQGQSFFPQLQLMSTGVTGNINVAGTFSGGQQFMDGAVVGGQTINAGTSSWAVWAQGDGTGNEEGGDIKGIGGFSGVVNLFHLNDVLISEDCDNSSNVDGGRWYNVRILNAKTIDFSAYTNTIQLDAASFKEVGMATAGFGGPVILMDDGFGVQYVPGAPAEWVGPPPGDVGTALDRMAALLFANFGPIP